MKSKEFSLEEKVKREIRTEMRLKRIPKSTHKLKPMVPTCSKCHKVKVTHHHFLCDLCWEKEHKNGNNRRY